jgi:hypothetical protein
MGALRVFPPLGFIRGHGNYMRLISTADHDPAAAVILDNPEHASVKGEHVDLSQHAAPVPTEDLHNIASGQL